MIKWRRLLKSKSERRPLRARNTNPGRLFRQCLIHKLVALVQTDLCSWLQFFQCRHAAHVVEVRMRQSNRLECETASLECLNNPFGFVAGIDADRLFGFITAYDTSVLLERRDSDFVYDHCVCT